MKIIVNCGECNEDVINSGQTNFDVLHGRVMGIDFAEGVWTSQAYDRANGADSAAVVVDAVRSEYLLRKSLVMQATSQELSHVLVVS